MVFLLLKLCVDKNNRWLRKDTKFFAAIGSDTDMIRRGVDWNCSDSLLLIFLDHENSDADERDFNSLSGCPGCFRENNYAVGQHCLAFRASRG
jgi:hypothetical protein